MRTATDLRFLRNAVGNASRSAIFLFLVFSLVGQAWGQTSANVNGSFESTPAGVVTDLAEGVEGWDLNVGSSVTNPPVFEVVEATDAPHGSKVLAVTVNGVGNNPWDIEATAFPVNVEPGVTYTYTIWARAEQDGAVVSFTVGNQSFQEYGRLHEQQITTEWQPFTFEFTVSDQETVIQAPIHFGYAANVGNTIYIDALVIMGPEPEPAGPELVANINGGFESTPAGVVTDLAEGVEGWDLNVGSSVTNPPVFEVLETSDAPEGNKVLAVTVNGVGNNPWDIEATAFPVNVRPGVTYTYTIWARAEQDGAVVSFTVGNQSYQEYGRLHEQQISTEWQQFTFEFTVSDQETVIRAPIHFGYAANVGNTIYIDGLAIVDSVGAWRPVIVEAEDGELGSEWAVETEGNVTYITITTDYNETTGDADHPGENRTATYQVTFPAPGWYDLYARVYVGPETFNDDSFFYANSFGVKDPESPDDWIIANQLAAAGYTEPDEYVTGLGAAGSEVWKWINLSENSFNNVPSDSFYVSPESLTVTFMIGARENGLRIDKLAFGRSELLYTVADLDTGGPGSPEPEEPPVVLPERPLAADVDKFLGNIYSPSQVENFEYYWNCVTPENAGKWGSVEGTRDQMNWSGLDAAYALARDNGFCFNFHVLLWGAQQPAWISELSPEEQLEEIQEWFQAVAERYSFTESPFDVVQVVNEPLHQPPDGQEGRANYIEALGGAGETGWDWVITAFELARQIFPEGTRLMINDYGILSSLETAQQYLELIQLLQERNLIDVIGVQGHAFSTRSGAPIQEVLDLLATTGLPIQVTEMDIDGNPNQSPFVTREQSEQNQLRDMQRIFPTVWYHPAVEGVTFWGWRPGLWRNDQEAYLVYSNGAERPAMVWLREYMAAYRDSYLSANDLGEGLPEEVSVAYWPNPSSGRVQFRYTLPSASMVEFRVFDVLGREVAVLASGWHKAGAYEVVFDGRQLPSGLYLYRLEAGGRVQSGRIVLMR